MGKVLWLCLACAQIKDWSEDMGSWVSSVLRLRYWLYFASLENKNCQMNYIVVQLFVPSCSSPHYHGLTSAENQAAGRNNQCCV